MICNGQEGFDNRFCTGGMWGFASYFAEQASYSNADKYAPRPTTALGATWHPPGTPHPLTLSPRECHVAGTASRTRAARGSFLLLPSSSAEPSSFRPMRPCACPPWCPTSRAPPQTCATIPSRESAAEEERRAST